MILTIGTMTTSTIMSDGNSDKSDIAAAWIVALALIVAMVVHVFLPATPPRLAPGVANAEAARIGTNLSGGSMATDSEVPLVEFGRSTPSDDLSAAGPVAGTPAE